VQKKTRQNLEYMQKGVTISPASPVVGDKVTILYDGILSKNGATAVFAHLGYGSNWDNEQDVPMVKGDICFEATVPALKEDFLKLSFKDPFNNIDDNTGQSYSFDITG
jgi:hypothetical protein